MRTTTTRTASPHLALDYQPSRPHGWPAAMGQPVGVTIGGHVASKVFTHNDRPYRISLLPFGQPGDAPDPVYEDVPTDPTLAFQQTLATAFGSYYAFQYTGGFRGNNELSVQSYSVYSTEPTEMSPGVSYGADLYVVYRPDRGTGDPAVHPSLRWIQVVQWLGSNIIPPDVFLDNGRRANPFHICGGITSVYGERVLSFDYGATVPSLLSTGDNRILSDHYTAEAFLVQDTGTRVAGGKDLLRVFGGIRYGWQVNPLS